MKLILYMTSLLRPVNLLQVFLFAALVVFLGASLHAGAENLGYNWQWYRVPRYLFATGGEGWAPGLLIEGLFVTLRITIFSLILCLLVGLVTALLRLSGSVMGQSLANVYLESVRNTPLLVQIFVIYFVLAPVLDIDRFFAAVLALGLFEGAYASEIIRAGILAVPRGQWEASRALGFGTPRCYRHIILPQAIRKVIPPLTSQVVSLVKDSALVSTIAIFDLTMRGQQIVAETFLTFEIWITIACIYLMLTVAISSLVKLLEGRLADY